MIGETEKLSKSNLTTAGVTYLFVCKLFWNEREYYILNNTEY